MARAKLTDAARGLGAEAVAARLAEFGRNELPEKKKSKLLQFLGYLWGPMPIMIWLAIVIELVKAVIFLKITGEVEGW